MEAPRTQLEDSCTVAKMVRGGAGRDAIHVSTGSMFPHPWNPAAIFPRHSAAPLQSVIEQRPIHLPLYLAFRYR